MPAPRMISLDICTSVQAYQIVGGLSRVHPVRLLPVDLFQGSFSSAHRRDSGVMPISPLFRHPDEVRSHSVFLPLMAGGNYSRLTALCRAAVL